MNRDDVIRMAREVGLLPDNSHPAPQTRSMADKQARLERFAAAAFAAGAAAEREACAKVAEETVCDTHVPTGVKIYGSRAAAAIRARGQS